MLKLLLETHLRMLLLLVGVVWSLAVNAQVPSSSIHQGAKKARIIIILDDMGNADADHRALQLPTEVVFSILPDTPQALALSYAAKQQNRDTMLHLPMQAQSGRELGPRAITVGMYQDTIYSNLIHALRSVPYAIGVNNHMGSELTQHVEPMAMLMREIKHLGLFFVDSRTTSLSVAEQVARDLGLRTAKRRVFLDHEQSFEFIDHHFHRLLRLARKYGSAIAIGHPYPSTLAYLEGALHQLPADIELIPISQHLGVHKFTPPRQPNDMAAYTAPQE